MPDASDKFIAWKIQTAAGEYIYEVYGLNPDRLKFVKAQVGAPAFQNISDFQNISELLEFIQKHGSKLELGDRITVSIKKDGTLHDGPNGEAALQAYDTEGCLLWVSYNQNNRLHEGPDGFAKLAFYPDGSLREAWTLKNKQDPLSIEELSDEEVTAYNVRQGTRTAIETFSLKPFSPGGQLVLDPVG